MAVTDDGMTVLTMPSCSVLVLVLIRALLFSRESYTVLAGSTVMVLSEEQLQKALRAMLVTVEGMSIPWSELQELKAYSPIVVNPSEKVTDCRLVHPLKAYSLIFFTASGMTISCRLMQAKKALLPARRFENHRRDGFQ